MGTKTTLSIISAIVLVLSYFTYLKIQESSRKEFSVITWDKYNICFLVPDNFIIEKFDDGFKYQGEKNKGHFILGHGALDPNYKESMIGDFKAAYKKVKNVRMFEYELAPDVILRDEFDFAKKTPANLIPVRHNCEKYLKHFKKSFAL
jgi:hypothetical protein